jgi:uncharacterized protein YdhG (YjbR/CyaY superfamily)
MAQLRPPVPDSAAVDQFMVNLDHPFKAEVQAIREIIKGVHDGITEEIKWKAPSFGFRDEYLVTFNLRARDRIHLVFHNPVVAQIESELLEGDYADRRMAYFSSPEDVRLQRGELERVLAELIRMMGGAP